MNMMPLTAALIVPNRNLWEQAHSCIRNLPVRIAVEQNEPTDADALLDRIERHRADVVLLEAGCLALPLEEFVRRLRNTPTQPAVFVLHTEASAQLILESLRAGAAEYLHTPLSDSLREAFEKLSTARSKHGAGGSRALGKIYGFISACGGCGATTIAVHVATELARQTKQPLLLADLDFEAGLLRFLMRSKNIYSVRDALDNMHRMDSSYWKALISTHANQIDFIAASDELATKRAPAADETVHLMRFIRSAYSLTVVDFGRSVNVTALDALGELETLYLVASLDLHTLDQAKRAIAMVEERGYAPNRVKLLLNRVPDRRVPDARGIEEYTGRAHAAVLTNDYMSLYDAYSEGRLLEAGTPLGKDLRAFAGSLIQTKPVVSGEKTVNAGWKSLLAGLRGRHGNN
jgi:pilus assembly protein CpaE